MRFVFYIYWNVFQGNMIFSSKADRKINALLTQLIRWIFFLKIFWTMELFGNYIIHSQAV